MIQRTRSQLGLLALLVAGFLYSNPVYGACPAGDVISDFESVVSCPGGDYSNWTSDIVTENPTTDGLARFDASTGADYLSYTARSANINYIELTSANFQNASGNNFVGRDFLAFSYASIDSELPGFGTNMSLTFDQGAGDYLFAASRPVQSVPLAPATLPAPSDWIPLYINLNYAMNLGVPINSVSNLRIAYTVVPAADDKVPIMYDNLRLETTGYTSNADIVPTDVTITGSTCSNTSISFPAANTKAGGSSTPGGYHIYRSPDNTPGSYVSVGFVGPAVTSFNDPATPPPPFYYKILTFDTYAANIRLMAPGNVTTEPAITQYNAIYNPLLVRAGIAENDLAAAAAVLIPAAGCPSPTPTFTATLTFTNSPTVTPSDTSTITVTPTITETFTFSPTATLTSTTSETFTPTETFTNSPTFTPTQFVSQTPTFTAVPPTPPNTFTATPSVTMTHTISPTPTISPTFSASPTTFVTLISPLLYPNPFRPDSPDPQQRYLRIGQVDPDSVGTVYDVAGDKVWETVLTGVLAQDTWDGVNQNGERAISGVYFLVVEQPVKGTTVHRIGIIRGR